MIWIVATIALLIGAALGWLAARLGAAREALEREALSRNERAAAVQAAVEEERKNAAKQLAQNEDARTRLADAFGLLAAEALNRNNDAFLKLAQENLGKTGEAARGELEKRQQAIGELVTPLREQLKRYEEQIQLLEKHRSQAYGDLQRQVTSLDQTQKLLKDETANLVSALRKPQVRGSWGELTLRRVVEIAGMIQHCDFVEQPTVESAEGPQRPDMIIHLPAERRIVVDAKAPLEAFLDATQAAGDEARQAALARHARHIRTHIDQLASKAYWKLVEPAPDFVVLFIPMESLLVAALEAQPDLYEIGLRNHVILATPSTLMTLLRTVELAWQQQKIAENAEEVSRLGSELYERLAKMCDHLTRLGASLKSSVGAYNEAIGSFESRVLPAARRFPELGVRIRETLPDALPELETQPRDVRAPEAATLLTPDAPAQRENA